VQVGGVGRTHDDLVAALALSVLVDPNCMRVGKAGTYALK
jgi:hypothetical protein